jgi:hypothetical protein
LKTIFRFFKTAKVLRGKWERFSQHSKSIEREMGALLKSIEKGYVKVNSIPVFFQLHD